MAIAIVGAGAIGGFLGVRLAAAGEDVTLVARGANLAAIKADGLRLIEEDGTQRTARVATTDSLELGHHDLVLLTLKAHQLGPTAAELNHLVGPDTTVVTMQNGIPWWYFLAGNHGGRYPGARLGTADPGGLIARHLDPARVIGSVVYPAAVMERPGVVRVVEGNRFGFGELDGSKSARVLALSKRFNRAGLKAPVTTDIRGEIWLKMLGNASFNPISALCHATLVDICRFPDTRRLAANMMREAEEVATELGVSLKLGIEQRIAGAEKVGAHKTSMLQDIEAGRTTELEPLVGTIIELGRLTGVATPHFDVVHALVGLLAHGLQAAGGRLAIAAG